MLNIYSSSAIGNNLKRFVVVNENVHIKYLFCMLLIVNAEKTINYCLLDIS